MRSITITGGWMVILAIIFFHLILAATSEQTVHVVFSNHVDLGFGGIGDQLGFDNNVFNKFFDEHFPRAIRLANEMRKTHPSRRLIWTTQPYLLSMFLDCPPGMGFHCPSKAQVEEVQAAIKRGDITWHAMPHNAQVELFDSSLLQAAIGMAHQLDARFSQPPKRTMSQRDVPGLTRAAIPILSAAGVQAISVGVNKGSSPPAVPHCTPFTWRDAPSNSSILAFWHPGGYGGKLGYLAVDSKEDCIIAEGLDHVLCVAWRGDNSGPPANSSEIGWVFDHLEEEFPGAKVQASTLDAFTAHLLAAAPSLNLPEVTGEIGDTWINGIASDPAKLADFRAVQRYRTGCLQAGFCLPSDPDFANFTRLLLKLPEHTWGLDIKQGMHDFEHWSNAELDECLAGQQNCRDMTAAWKRQYGYINWALEALGSDHQISMAFAADWTQRHQPPPHHKPSWVASAKHLYSRQRDSSLQSKRELEWGNQHLKLCLDTQTGSITHLERLWPSSASPTGRQSGMNWAEGARLFQIMYSTYTEASYDTIWEHYKYLPDLPLWYFADFGKPNVSLASPLRADVQPILEDVYEAPSEDGLVTLMRYIFPTWAVEEAGAPQDMWIQMHVPADSSKLQLIVGWKGKRPTRLPEALWFSVFTKAPSASGADSNSRLQDSGSGSRYTPDDVRDKFKSAWGLGAGEKTGVDPKTWRLSKMGSWIDPLDVVLNGSQSMHSVDDEGVRVDSLPLPSTLGDNRGEDDSTIWKTTRRMLAGAFSRSQTDGSKEQGDGAGAQEQYRERLQIRTLDASLVSPGTPNPFPNPDRPPSMEDGAHFNLVNNIWGTNYIMWFPYADDQNITPFRFEVEVTQLKTAESEMTGTPQTTAAT